MDNTIHIHHIHIERFTEGLNYSWWSHISIRPGYKFAPNILKFSVHTDIHIMDAHTGRGFFRKLLSKIHSLGRMDERMQDFTVKFSIFRILNEYKFEYPNQFLDNRIINEQSAIKKNIILSISCSICISILYEKHFRSVCALLLYSIFTFTS